MNTIGWKQNIDVTENDFVYSNFKVLDGESRISVLREIQNNLYEAKTSKFNIYNKFLKISGLIPYRNYFYYEFHANDIDTHRKTALTIRFEDNLLAMSYNEVEELIIEYSKVMKIEYNEDIAKTLMMKVKLFKKFSTTIKTSFTLIILIIAIIIYKLTH